MLAISRIETMLLTMWRSGGRQRSHRCINDEPRTITYISKVTLAVLELLFQPPTQLTVHLLGSKVMRPENGGLLVRFVSCRCLTHIVVILHHRDRVGSFNYSSNQDVIDRGVEGREKVALTRSPLSWYGMTILPSFFNPRRERSS